MVQLATSLITLGILIPWSALLLHLMDPRPPRRDRRAYLNGWA